MKIGTFFWGKRFNLELSMVNFSIAFQLKYPMGEILKSALPDLRIVVDDDYIFVVRRDHNK